MVKIAIFTANYIGKNLLEKLDSYNYYPHVITYNNNFQRTSLSRNFSNFTKKFPITFINSNKFKDIYEKLRFFDVDFFICIDWTKDFFKGFDTNQILNKSGKKIEIIFAHPSLLPMYRGYGAISEQFIRGVIISGISFYKLSEIIDGGEIVYQDKIKIEFNDYPKDFINKFNESAINFILNLKDIGNSYLKNIKQDENKSFYLVRQRSKQALIDFNRNSLSVYNHIRGYSKPFFGAFFIQNDKKIYVLKASIESWQGDFGKPGKIINKDENGIEVALGDGSIIFNEIEIEGKIYQNKEIPFEKGNILS